MKRTTKTQYAIVNLQGEVRIDFGNNSELMADYVKKQTELHGPSRFTFPAKIEHTITIEPLEL